MSHGVCSKCGSHPIPERYAGTFSFTKCPSGGVHDFSVSAYVPISADLANALRASDVFWGRFQADLAQQIAKDMDRLFEPKV